MSGWKTLSMNTRKPCRRSIGKACLPFSLARLAYRRKQYDLALELLQKSKYEDLLLNLAAKTLQLKTYYELSEWDKLSAHLEAMKRFVNRKKVIGYHRQNYLNIINYTQKLLKVNPFDKSAVVDLQKEDCSRRGAYRTRIGCWQ